MSLVSLSLRRTSIALLLLLSGLGACIGDGAVAVMTPGAIPGDSVIRLKSDSFFLTVGDNALIAGTVRSIAGDAAADQPIHWSTQDSAIVAIDDNGVVTGVSPGAAQVTGAYDDGTRVQVQIFVTAVLRPVARIVMSPPNITLTAGATARVTVQTLDDAGIPVAGAIVAFSSDSTQVATVRVTTTRTRELNQIYIVSAVGAGTTHVNASSDGATASALVIVHPAVTPVTQVAMTPANVGITVGGTAQLNAQALDRNGDPVPGSPVSFSSDATTVAIVDQTGVVTALSPGTARITATSRGVSAVSQVLVSSAAIPVAQIQLTPPSVTLPVGSTLRIVARALDATGNDVAGAQVHFASNTPTIASVDAEGVVTAVAPGNTQVIVSSQGVTTTATVTITPRSVAQLVVSPASLTITAGATAALSVQALDDVGVPVSGAVVSFTSNALSVATVSQAGVVTGVAPGSTQITVSSQGVSAIATIVVNARPVWQVLLTPSNWTLTAGSTAQLNTQVLDNVGNPIPGATIAYVTSAPAIASVSASGVITAIAPGTAQVTATSQGISGTATVVVTPRPVAQVTLSPATLTMAAGSSLPLTAQALDNNGVPIAGAVFTFVSAATTIVSVNTNGEVTAIGPGTTQVTASSQGFSGSATITVTPRPVAQVTVTPSSVSLSAGATAPLSAQALDNTGAPVGGAVIAFVSGSTAIATVNASGVVTGVAPGTTQVTASSQGFSGTATITVTSRPVAQVTVSPTTVSLFTGATVPLTAQAVDNTGAPVAGAVVTFTSAAVSIATVNASGVVTGVAPGTTQVTASSQGFSGTATITVTLRPVATVSVTPSSVSLTAGTTTALTAQALDNLSLPVVGAVITYTSANTSVATVNSSGVVTGVAQGTTQVTATSQGISGTASITVTPRPVASVTVSPSSLSLFTGATGPITAQAKDNTGAVIPGAVITFASAAPSIATVNSGGVVTGIAPGTTQVTATSQGFSASATVIVSARPVSQVTLSPSTLSLAAGATSQLTAQAKDNTGAVVAGATITFASDATSVATVSQTGVVTALAPGSATISATSNGITATSAITVLGSGLAMDVNPSISYQTISGWEATTQIGELECNQTAYQAYRNTVLDRTANEMGINRMRLEIKSGIEHTTDYFAQYQSGQITMSALNQARYKPVNDNADPFTINPAGFKWTALDYSIDQVVNPMRQRLAARGEHLMVNLILVDFKTTPWTFNQMQNAEEYAELIAAAFQHIQQKYGWTPDALELLLEPENTPWTGTQMGQALVATANRLNGMGFSPDFIGPSTTASGNAPAYWDAMRQVPGAAALLDELAYHRYDQVTTNNLLAIDSRRVNQGVRTSMLEHLGSGIDDLYEDLTVANVSAWQQYTLAFCITQDDGSAYYMINQSSPSNPIVTMSSTAGQLSQVFRYVRAGAVRVGATSANSGLAKVVAFRNTNNKYAVIVRTQGSQQLLIRGLPAGTYGVNYATASSVNVSAADVVISAGGSASVSIPAAGAITIYAR